MATSLRTMLAGPAAIADRLMRAIERLPTWGVWVVALGAVAGLGGIDLATGSQLSFSIFYLLPVSLVAWRLRLRWALLIASLAATVWLLADLAHAPSYTHSAIPFWNALVRFGFFAIVSTLLARVREALLRERDRATVDSLTGLANGRAFYAALDREVERSRRYLHPLTVAYIDVDDFKQVNDRFGHQTGDQVLVEFASALESQLRATDLVARLGGDEFGVLLPETGRAAAEAVFAKMLERLRSVSTPDGKRVQASVGVTVCEAAPDSSQELLHQADKVMYRAKERGKHRVLYSVYEPVAVAAELADQVSK